MGFESFTCVECDGGTVELETGPGRTYQLRRDTSVDVPEDFGIPKCTDCGEVYLTASEAKKLAEFANPTGR